VGKQILVVDDDSKNLDILSRLLKARGYETTTASDGAEALAKARATMPDLILMDLKMPGMDGYETTRHLKADPRSAGIPIIVFSASAMDEHMREAQRAGCDEFVSKPIDWSVLYEKMELLLT